MHSIRSLARKEAWGSNEDGSTNYNPFARSRGGRRIQDPEAGALHKARTADSFPSRLEADRGLQSQEDYHHPNRADTAPADLKGQPPRTGAAAPPSNLPQVAEHSQHVTPEPIHDSPDVSPVGAKGDVPLADSSSSEPAREEKSGLRQRFKFGKHDRSETTDTGASSEKWHTKWRKGRNIPVGKQIRAVLLGSWINLLLLAVPVGFAIRYAKLPDEKTQGIASFVVNIVAIVPLAATLGFATEELALYVGETLGGLLNATFGNATELIVSIIALTQNKVLIVQTSLIGSMLSNLLLVLGMCFFFGGITRVKQHFNVTVALTASSLLALAIGSLVVPTAFFRFGNDTSNEITAQGVLPVSYGTAIILLVVYVSYLYFQLSTHKTLYNEPSPKGEKRKSKKKEKGAALASMANIGAGHAHAAGGNHKDKQHIMKDEDDHDDDEAEEPTLSVVGALVTLLGATVLIAFCSDFMVSGIDFIAPRGGGLSQEFVGLILIPIVGNAAEHATAVTVAIKDKMDLAIGVAVGSSIQIALLVFPLVVVIAWCGAGKPPSGSSIDKYMSLNFDGFQVVVLFIAVLLVNYLIQDGESHWLEGVLLMSTYIIIAVAAGFYPTNDALAG